MASLQAALKNAIQVRYQLEDNEIAAEPLPSADDRRSLLLYESAEGGAGVLRRLLDDTDALAEVAKESLRLCHYDPETGEDLNHAPRAKERCEVACYDCLMSYYNQREHDLLNRHIVVEWLQILRRAEVITAPVAAPRAAHLAELLRKCDSELERRWLRRLDARGHRLPTGAQVYIEACQTRPDFVYEEHHTVIYVDGPHHDFPDRHIRDRQQADWLEDRGYTVIRFGHDADWDAVLNQYPSVFGAAPETFLSNAPGDSRRLELELFDAQWHALLANLSKGVEGIEIEPGEDVMREGRVIGGYFARLTLKGNALHLVAAGEITLDQLVEVLQEQGKRALVVSPDAKAEAELEILKALGVN